MKTKQSSDLVADAGTSTSIAVQEVQPAVAVVEHAEPKSGGSFVRDLDTGELIQTAGPALDDQPSKE